MKLSVILGVSMAALALVPLGDAAGGALADRAARQFVPPAGEIVLARSLIRELSDGKQIVVNRRYRIRFVSIAGGYRVEGDLVGVSVEAPPILSNLADLERRRVDPGPFPMELGNDGQLREQSPTVPDPGLRAEVQAQAGALLLPRAETMAGRAEVGRVIGKLAQGGATSPWPADLFNANPGERRLERQVNLADGRTGAVEVVLRVDTLLPCGLPRRFERTVTTQLPGSRTVSHEVFTFEYAAK
ncbi:MAG: hypothetical protein WBL74_10800 [Novosphingobium sp.]|uniref:hypothetical protein n=1 Tax=Novosphingobium sp. TaxID=1874826 RepID=UPI003C7D77F2